MSDQRLDGAIDEVAHEMTAGAPHDHAAFRRAVLARIDSESPPRRSGRAAWVVAPLAAAAAIAIAAVLWPPTERTAPGAQPTANSAGDVALTVPPVRIPATAVADRHAPAAHEATATPREVRPPLGMSAAGGPASSRNSYISSLAPPALAMDSIAIDPIAVDTIDVARLPAAESIQLEQLDPIPPIAVTPIGSDDSQRRER
jgi:hypothetical protein